MINSIFGISSYFITRSSHISPEEIKSHPLFARITTHEARDLSFLMERVDDSCLKENCDAILEANLHNSLFYQENWLAIAMKGYFKGYLTESQVCQASHLETYLNALYFAGRSLSPIPSDLEKIFYIEGLDDEEVKLEISIDVNIETAIRTLGIASIDTSDLSPLEKIIFKVTLPLKKMTDRKSIFHRYKQMHFEAFMSPDGYYMTSLAILQRCIDAKTPGNKLKVFPTFGYSKKLQRFAGILDQRAIFFHCPYINTPSNIHNYRSCSKFCMSFHDFYHTWTTQFNPYRHLEDSFGQQIQGLFKSAAISLFDHDFRLYEPGRNSCRFYLKALSQEEAFWAFQIEIIVNNIIPKDLESYISILFLWVQKNPKLDIPSFAILDDLGRYLSNRREDSKEISERKTIIDLLSTSFKELSFESESPSSPLLSS